MQTKIQRISPCLWFDRQAEEAVALYTSIFPNSHIGTITRHGKESAEISGIPEGTVLAIDFQLDGVDFAAINGGPIFKFTEAISLVIKCDTQAEVDHYWTRLSEGGDEKAQQCGWLKDRYGLSWQVTPVVLYQLLSDPDPARATRASAAMMQMKKLDIAALLKAADG
ncbi:VOC family protein [Chondromyces crocatus]|uniref:3-demethylubiquinone-9 3-methyltransferase n=1 Tax=Chondromyces crocatus TaxID=52 RepID=A0A0K1EP07_CHOCO|nr:VOC family protein [Chondromyces crocatus]AKT42358.1 3-demethylubiquinone-9 3-methyltransferase [Chondromyces crocatus]